jgi:hypothetical protein
LPGREPDARMARHSSQARQTLVRLGPAQLGPVQLGPVQLGLAQPVRNGARPQLRHAGQARDRPDTSYADTWRSAPCALPHRSRCRERHSASNRRDRRLSWIGLNMPAPPETIATGTQNCVHGLFSTCIDAYDGPRHLTRTDLCLIREFSSLPSKEPQTLRP